MSLFQTMQAVSPRRFVVRHWLGATVIASTFPASPAPAQEASPPLVVAESLLVTGDTAAALPLLRALAAGDINTSDAALAANFALLWIGRGHAWRPVHKEWQARANTFRNRNTLTVSAKAMAVAADVERLDQSAFQQAMSTIALLIDSLRRAPARFQQNMGPGLVSGAIRWTLSQHDLASVGRALQDSIPQVRYLPSDCARSGRLCAIRGTPPPEASSLADLVQRVDGARVHLALARTALTVGLSDPWPFNELSARTLLAVDVLFGGERDLMDLGSAIASSALSERTRTVLNGAILEFAGQRNAAAALMQKHPAWFTPFDTVMTALANRSGLSPAVLWRTGWPLYLEPYNERLTVHRARFPAADALARFVAPDTYFFSAFADPAGVLRRGLPVAYARVGRRPTRSSVLLLYLDRRTIETLLSVGESSVEGSVDLALASSGIVTRLRTSGYVPQHFDDQTSLSFQVARYVQEGKPSVEFHAVLPPPNCEGSAPEVGFFLLDQTLVPIRRSVDNASVRRRYRYAVDVPPGSYVYSLEMRDTVCRQSARARYALSVPAPSPGLSLSDVVLADELHLTDVTRLHAERPMVARAGRTASVTKPLLLYWEIYGVSTSGADREPNRLRVTVDVTKVAVAHSQSVEGFDAQDSQQRRAATKRLEEVQRAADSARPAAAVSYDLAVPPGDRPLAMGQSLNLHKGTEGVHRIRLTVTDHQTGAHATVYGIVFITSDPSP